MSGYVVARTIEDCLRLAAKSGLAVLVVRLQDKENFPKAVWLGDLLREAGVRFYKARERVAAMLSHNLRDLRQYAEHLADKGIYDLPFRLPPEVLSRYGPFCVVAPKWLVWDVHAAKSAGCLNLIIVPPEQTPVQTICHCAATLAAQTRSLSSVSAVITPAYGPSFSFLSLSRSAPQTRKTPISAQQDEDITILERFGLGKEDWRRWALLLQRQQVVDWKPKRPFVCPAEDTPILSFKTVAVCGLVEGEGDCETAVKIGGLVAAETLHLWRYREHGGKVVFAHLSYQRRCHKEKQDENSHTFSEVASTVERKVPQAKVILRIKALSPSSLERYLECPRKFLFEQLGIPHPESTATLLGSLIHKILELHHKGEISSPEKCAQDFLAERNVSRLERQLLIRDAITLYKRYVESGKGNIGDVFLVEKRFEVEINGIPFVCRLDRVDRLGDGYVVVDYKRRGEKKEKALINKFARQWEVGSSSDYQVPVYIEALRQHGLWPVKAFFYIFLDFKNTGCVERVELKWSEIEVHFEKALRMASDLGCHILSDQQFLPPKNPPCRSTLCHFRPLCPF